MGLGTILALAGTASQLAGGLNRQSTTGDTSVVREFGFGGAPRSLADAVFQYHMNLTCNRGHISNVAACEANARLIAGNAQKEFFESGACPPYIGDCSVFGGPGAGTVGFPQPAPVQFAGTLSPSPPVSPIELGMEVAQLGFQAGTAIGNRLLRTTRAFLRASARAGEFMNVGQILSMLTARGAPNNRRTHLRAMCLAHRHNPNAPGYFKQACNVLRPRSVSAPRPKPCRPRVYVSRSRCCGC